MQPIHSCATFLSVFLSTVIAGLKHREPANCHAWLHSRFSELRAACLYLRCRFNVFFPFFKKKEEKKRKKKIKAVFFCWEIFRYNNTIVEYLWCGRSASILPILLSSLCFLWAFYCRSTISPSFIYSFAFLAFVESTISSLSRNRCDFQRKLYIHSLLCFCEPPGPSTGHVVSRRIGRYLSTGRHLLVFAMAHRTRRVATPSYIKELS